MLDSDGTVLHQLLALPLRTDPEIIQPMKEITSVAMKSKGGLAARDTDQAWLDTHESGYQLTQNNGRGSTSKSARASPSRAFGVLTTKSALHQPEHSQEIQDLRLLSLS